MSEIMQTQGDIAAGTNAALQNISMTNSTYLPLHQIKMNPSKKDVTDSWEELLVNIKAYAQLKDGVN